MCHRHLQGLLVGSSLHHGKEVPCRSLKLAKRKPVDRGSTVHECVCILVALES